MIIVIIIASDMEVAMMNSNGRPLSREEDRAADGRADDPGVGDADAAGPVGLRRSTVPADAVERRRQPRTLEKFVPGTARFAAGATLELRGEATVVGDEVKLKQVCRWSEPTTPCSRRSPTSCWCGSAAGTPFRAVTVGEVKDDARATRASTSRR